MDAKPLLFGQIGDLHLTEAGENNFRDFCAIAAQLETQCQQLDFIFLPGDNADQGRPEQYKLAATALRMLSARTFAIPGDHDMEQGSLVNFYKGINTPQLPHEIRLRDYACFFLDCCGQGSGGPDFRLGFSQLQWLENGLKNAVSAGLSSLVFMHTYPADLADPNERRLLNNWFDSYDVRLVAMGHTHYNELANDGKTVFCATRSTGQIEEGPVGYSLIAVDGENISWRFKQLADPFPFVLITSPGDYRLTRDGLSGKAGNQLVRATVFGEYALKEVSCQFHEGDWWPMTMNEETKSWEAEAVVPITENRKIIVKAIDERGRPGFHQVEVRPAETRTGKERAPGSDDNRILFWPENGIPGSQLGPNRNARPFPKPKKP